jgi:phospholipase D1/2
MRSQAPLIIVALLAGMLGGVWWAAGSAGIISADTIQHWLASARGNPWAPAVVLVTFLVAGVVAFPIHAVVLATAAVFGPWLGFAYSAIGSFSCALPPYFLGAYLGKERVARLLGSKSQRVFDALRKRGVLVVVGFRLVPVAPGTVVNLALGASGIRLADFVIGSAMGMIPGLLLISFIGDRLVAVMTNPAPGEVGLLALCIVAYLALVFGAQLLLSRRYRRQ